MRLYTRVCFKDWPRHYATYYQETVPPYRRCDNAHVLRIGSFGLVVVPRWTGHAENEADALTYGLCARDVEIDDGPDAEVSFRSLRHREH